MAKKILIADDSSSMRQMINFTLKSNGYEVVEAVDGVDGLAKAKATVFNMVLTDLNMPKMDGITFIKELRKNPSTKFIPIVMLTTESQAAKKQEGKAAGASGWIVKPFQPDQLVVVVKKLIGV